MKLQFLVPHYNEEWSEIKPLLDSIAIQQNVDMNDIGVIIVNDGDKCVLDENLFTGYPYKIEYYINEHKGVSATRNACLDKATADYVMFCDCDDMFCNVCGLWILIREMQIGEFDSLVSAFVEETRLPNGEIFYINHDMDSTFVHGKVHRRKYLIDNNIRWNESLTIHEDSYFNCLCQKLSTNVKFCPTPFYLWKWRDNSVCRHDKLYLNKTYRNMLDSNTALVKEFLKRGKKEEAMFFATSMIYDAYYSFNCDRWWNEEGHSYLIGTERRFKEYYMTFKNLFNELPKEYHNQIIMGIKNRFFQEGLMLERITFNEWINHIESL